MVCLCSLLYLEDFSLLLFSSAFCSCLFSRLGQISGYKEKRASHLKAALSLSHNSLQTSWCTVDILGGI